MAWAAVGILALGMLAPVRAQTFKFANQGDALSMDPHSLNESLQLSFTGNLYEPLIGRGKKLELRAGTGDGLEADRTDRVALQPAQERASSTTARRSPPTT